MMHPDVADFLMRCVTLVTLLLAIFLTVILGKRK